jgi:orotidine-5'-phosphate decarboxylase
MPMPADPLASGSLNARFSDRLAAAIDRAGVPACVGIDPVLDKLPPGLRSAPEPARAIHDFSVGVCDAVARVVPAVKFQSACYERFGDAGVAALRESIRHARSLGLVVVLDAKRGDIGISAEHYAAAAFTPPFDADSLTVSPYLGMDTIEPYLKHAGRGVFVLVRTSNPGSDALQNTRTEAGRTIAQLVGAMVSQLGVSHRGVRGLSDVGAVVGATKPADAAALRAAMPDQVFLVPGYGAQGGTVADIRAMIRPSAKAPGDMGVLVTASRSVIYPAWSSPNWQDDVRAAAKTLAKELHALQ